MSQICVGRITLTLILFFFISPGLSKQCKKIYKRYSEKHTACLPPNSTCTILDNKVSEEDIKVILKEHNEYRSMIANGKELRIALPKATNMLQMEWDPELAKVAQAHANQCVMDHDCNDCRRVLNFSVGQNLYESKGNSKTKPDWAKAIKLWYDEVVDFKTEYINPFSMAGGGYGHFTQEVWAETWKVGCGYALHKEEDVYQALYTCDYGPAGNMYEGVMYKEGDPCSECPINSCCDTTCSSKGTSADYPGLCKITDGKRPKYPLPEIPGLIFRCGFGEGDSCPVSVIEGSSKWKVTTTLSDTYIGIVLKGGENSKLRLDKPFKGTASSCLIFFYRKGPVIKASRGESSAVAHFFIKSMNFDSTVNFEENNVQFTEFSMNLGWEYETEFSMSFSVPEGSPPQYFEMKDITAKDGAC